MADQLPSLYEMYMQSAGMVPSSGVGARSGALGSDVANPSQPQRANNPGNLNIGGTPANAPLGVGGMPWGPPPQTMSFGMDPLPEQGPPPGTGGSGTSGASVPSGYPPGPSGQDTGGLYPDWTGTSGVQPGSITDAMNGGMGGGVVQEPPPGIGMDALSGLTMPEPAVDQSGAQTSPYGPRGMRGYQNMGRMGMGLLGMQPFGRR